MLLFFWHNLSTFADFLSIGGFIITCWIAVTFNKIQKSAEFKGRFLAFRREFTKYASDLSISQTSNILDENEVRRITINCEASIKSILRIAPQRLKAVFDGVYNMTQPILHNNQAGDRPSLDRLYDALIKLGAELKNYQEEEKWRMQK